MANYNVVKGEITLNPETKEQQFQFESGTMMKTIDVKFTIDPQEQWRKGVSQYGPWCLIGRINVKDENGYEWVHDDGLFGRYDKETVVGGGIKIKDGVYLNLYFQKDPTKIVYYFKFDTEKESPVDPKDLPF